MKRLVNRVFQFLKKFFFKYGSSYRRGTVSDYSKINSYTESLATAAENKDHNVDGAWPFSFPVLKPEPGSPLEKALIDLQKAFQDLVAMCDALAKGETEGCTTDKNKRHSRHLIPRTIYSLKKFMTKAFRFTAVYYKSMSFKFPL